MYTLSDINALTNSDDGSIYSDMFKDIYGGRPRHAMFASVEEFDQALKSLSAEMEREIAREKSAKKLALESFMQLIEDTKAVVIGCDTKRALELIAQAEGYTDEDMMFYGWEILEYNMGIDYGSVEAILGAC